MISMKRILFKGTFAGFRVENATISGLEYLFGDIDGCSSHRETFISIECGKSDRLAKVDEIHSCAYRGILEWKRACDPDRLLLYPILSELGKESVSTNHNPLNYHDPPRIAR